MGKQKAPPAPDYSAVAAASERSAALSYKLGQEQLAWAKEQYANDRGVTDQIVNGFLSDMTEQSQNAKADRDRYESTFQPLENDLVDEAKSYDTPERRNYEMGKAGANVSQQFEAARENATRDLEAYGIDPSSTRYAALDIGVRTQQAAATAAAGNAAGDQVDATARQLRADAINIGKGYPAQAAQGYAGATITGNSANGQQLATTASGANTMGTAPQYMGLGNQAVGQWGNTLNMGYQNALAGYQANQQASSGWGSALGLVGGLGLKAFGLAEGGSVEDDMAAEAQGAIPDGMPRPPQAGGAVPAGMSKTRGAVEDDVPARLTVGEFVVPKDAVSWLGEKHFYGIIEKTAKERAETKQRTGAVPADGPPLDEHPVYASSGAV